MFRYKFLLVPVQLSQLAFQKKQINLLSTFLNLKMVAGDRFKKNDGTLSIVAKKLPSFKTKRTLVTHLKKLVRLNWVGYNSKTNLYYLRSMDSIMKMNKLSASTCCVYYPKNSLTIRKFLFASVIGAVINHNKKKRREMVLKTRCENDFDGTLQVFRPSFYYGMATSKIADKMGYSYGIASRDLSNACIANYLTKRQKNTIYFFKNLSDAKGFIKVRRALGVKGLIMKNKKNGEFRVFKVMMNEIECSLPIKSKYSLRKKSKR